ncbi:MAG: hypothetical protein MUE68_12905 [Bacteroidetes bacterium]|jgi:hypothetical protein|nr:hypothetical protein [Bacteroidota bacterium]
MTAEQILKELEELADRSGITIRYEKGDFDGGYCVLKAERLIVVNRKLAPTKRGSVVAQAIAEVGVEEVYLKPAVREFIEEELSKAAQEALRAAGIAAAAHEQTVAETSALAVAPSQGSAGSPVETETADPATTNEPEGNVPSQDPGGTGTPERAE